MPKISILEKHIGSILTALVVSFILGTFGLFTNIAILSERVSNLTKKLEVQQEMIQVSTSGRWTRVEHDAFDRALDRRLNNMTDRIIALENK